MRLRNAFARRITSVHPSFRADLSAAEPDVVGSLLLFTELASRVAEIAGAGVGYAVEKNSDQYVLRFSFKVEMPKKLTL